MSSADASATPAAQAAPTATTAAASNGRPKKLHGRAFYESIGSPKHVVAPMVDQSEFAWRMLTRSFLPPDQRTSVLAYSPMLHARLFVDSPRYRTSHFEAVRDSGSSEEQTGSNANGSASNGPLPFLDGNPAIDRPLFVQFCANDPEALLGAARQVAPYCDAVDLNLGCPQGIARKGHYGAFLQEEPELIAKLIRTLHENLDVPVTAKIRLLDTPEASLQYARTVLAAGASILTVHGRRREQKGHMTGIADWKMLRYLRENLPKETVLFANGNVLEHGDVERCLAATGFDGVMSAEGLLSNPALFSPPPPPPASATASDEAPVASSATAAPPAYLDYYWHTPDTRREYWTSSRSGSRRGGWRIDAVMRRYLDILHVYCLGKKAPPAREPLFIVGDPVERLKEDVPETTTTTATANADDAGPARKKRRTNGHAVAAAATSTTTAANKDLNKEIFASPNFIAVQAHLFHLLRHAVAKHHDIRDSLARTRKGDMAGYERILSVLEKRVGQALVAGEDKEFSEEWEAEAGDPEAEEAAAAAAAEIFDDPNSSEAAVRRCKRPWWVVQPILRPMPAEALAKGAIQLKKKVKAELEKADKAEAPSSKAEETAAAA
ncbi:tRNA dihydrouridine synthase [Sporothrix curviconia]|uniref:tRNA-dihydrouridine(16/17) synthase [NAD(P)(+)] n=1 Tax=Sporothrix curviconia TaxID=1260050 RepID=A0ABP0CGH9_9PEZI